MVRGQLSQLLKSRKRRAAETIEQRDYRLKVAHEYAKSHKDEINAKARERYAFVKELIKSKRTLI